MLGALQVSVAPCGIVGSSETMNGWTRKMGIVQGPGSVERRQNAPSSLHLPHLFTTLPASKTTPAVHSLDIMWLCRI